MKKFYVLAAILACVPATAFAQDAAPVDEATTKNADFDGVRFEARLGYETPTVSGNGQVYKIGSAASYGGEAGFDVKLGTSVVAGPYAVYEFSSVKLCDGPDCIKEQGNLGAGARIGVAVTPTVLVYGKAGYARISFSANSAFGTDSDSKSGVQGAIGVDVNLGKNVYAMVEVDYGDYGQFYGVNLQRRHVAGGIGVRF